jgi:hypothetical protein
LEFEASTEVISLIGTQFVSHLTDVKAKIELQRQIARYQQIRRPGAKWTQAIRRKVHRKHAASRMVIFLASLRAYGRWHRQVWSAGEFGYRVACRNPRLLMPKSL